MENLPPVDGGDTVQITPVGGAPNDNGAMVPSDDQGPELESDVSAS
jgi:hypothetical protein